ncbi:MAG: glycosyltransferase [Bacteroidales bacterium]|nr:glycosyltransferase [Bacteroidales bacterium]
MLAALMLAAMLFLCLYYGLYHFRLGRHGLKDGGAKADDAALPPVSVVLTAHNEAEWLKENLVYLLEQEYPNFEVVVVDYLSTDDTQYVLKVLMGYYPHLKVRPFLEDVNLFQGRKYPLSIGIKSAANDILLLADPECIPSNLHWLRGMVRGYMDGSGKVDGTTQVVLGYCGVKPTRSLLGWLQQYDALAYGSQYLGSALLGHVYTGSGRNLSYRRGFFFERGGFISHYDIADGSDDLFVYQNANRGNTRICIDSDAVLMVEPCKSFAQWHAQRRRRVASRSRHKLGGRLRESLPMAAVALFYAAAVALLLLGTLPWPVVALAAAMKWAWQIVCFSMLTKRFDGGWVHWVAPLMEIYFTVANTILILLPLSSNRKF